MKHRTIRGLTVLLIVLAVSAISLVVIAGCGGELSVEGVYKLKAGEDFTAVLTLKAGNKATYSLSDDGSGMPVDYEVKDDTVVLIGADGKEVPNASYKIEDDGLRDTSGNLWEKE